MKVLLKFGGTSVGSIESIEALLNIVKGALEAPQKSVVVLVGDGAEFLSHLTQIWAW